MVSGRYRKIDDILKLDQDIPRASRYLGENQNLKMIVYSERLPESKYVLLVFKDKSKMYEFIKLFNNRINAFIKYLEYLEPFEPKIDDFNNTIRITTNETSLLKFILSIACEYAEIKEPLKLEITQLPNLNLPPFMEALFKLADVNFASAKRVIENYIQWKMSSEVTTKEQEDFIDSLFYQLGLHFEGKPETLDKAIVCFDEIKKENNHNYNLAQLHRERCYKLFMESKLHNSLLDENVLLRKEIATLNERLTKKKSSVQEKDERKQNNNNHTIFKNQ